MDAAKNHHLPIFEQLSVIFSAVDQVLNEWPDKKDLSFPILIPLVAAHFGWAKKDTLEADPIIRYYVRRHRDWYSTRGAYGGIKRKADFLAKEANKIAKEVFKQQMRDTIASKEQQSNKTALNIDVDRKEEIDADIGVIET